MVIRTLRMQAFRAHADTTVTFAPKVNVFYGPNGAGKTNILEAVHYACLSKSFLSSKDRYALRKGCPHFDVEGEFVGQWRANLSVRLVYAPGVGKRGFLNRRPLDRIAEIVGRLPVVVCSQADHALTSGGPEERRRFLNNIMSQARPVYLDNLLKYRRTLRQRNELLSKSRRRPGALAPAVLESWNAKLVALGSRVIVDRLHFLTTFSGFLQKAYGLINSVAEHPTVDYRGLGPFVWDADEEAVATVFREKLHRAVRRERELGRALVGPHRDELTFRIEDFEVRRYASQGQHRTFGMAIKLAQYFYLSDRLEEAPILLLDDVFDPLDKKRTEVFLSLLTSDAIGQALITGAESDVFTSIIPFDQSEHLLQRVDGGSVTR